MVQFLRYLYYDDTNLGDVDGAIQVRYLADKYGVPSLRKESVISRGTQRSLETT